MLRISKATKVSKYLCIFITCLSVGEDKSSSKDKSIETSSELHDFLNWILFRLQVLEIQCCQINLNSFKSCEFYIGPSFLLFYY